MACWTVLPLVVRGTTAPSAVLPLRDGTRGLSRGRGRFLLPHTHSLRPSFLFLSPASSRRGSAPVDLRLRGVPLHFLWWSRSPPRPLAMDAGIAPVPSFFYLFFSSCFLGAMVVASLDFWLNLGLSWLEMATRLSRLEFGRNIFEFGRPVVPDLTAVVRTRCFTASCYMKLLFLHLKQYYRSSWSGTTA